MAHTLADVRIRMPLCIVDRGSTGSQKACLWQALPPIRTTPEPCEFTIFTHECRRRPRGRMVSPLRVRFRLAAQPRTAAIALADRWPGGRGQFPIPSSLPSYDRGSSLPWGGLEPAADRRRGFGSIGPKPFRPLLRTYAGDVRCLLMSSTGDRGGRALTSAMRPSRLRVLATCNWPPLTSISNHPGFQPSAKDADMAGRVAKRP